MFEYKTKFYFKNGLKIKLGADFLRYYYWHILKSHHSTLGLGLPMHGAHVSITLPAYHGDAVEVSKKYSGEDVSVFYSGEIIKGGSYFTNFWMPMDIPKADDIKTELGIVEKKFLGFHLTICNDKSFINSSNEEARKLTEKLNKDNLSIDEHRKLMLKLKL